MTESMTTLATILPIVGVGRPRCHAAATNKSEATLLMKSPKPGMSPIRGSMPKRRPFRNLKSVVEERRQRCQGFIVDRPGTDRFVGRYDLRIRRLSAHVREI